MAKGITNVTTKAGSRKQLKVAAATSAQLSCLLLCGCRREGE